MKKIISVLLLCATVLFTSCKDPIPVVVTDVKVNKDILSLVVGTKEVLVATVNPKDADDKSVTWSSSDVAVATVSTNGEVSALKAGIATITVTSNSDKTKKATCALTVTDGIIKATGVALDKTALSVVMGTNVTLLPTITPVNTTDKTVTWTSSVEAVATVSTAGVVTPVSVGTSKITVTTKDGNFTAVCDVTVTAVVVAVESVELNKTTAAMVVGGTTETLLPTITPVAATDKTVTWTTTDAAVATVVDGVVTAVGAGTATIAAASVSDKTKFATCTVTVTAAVVNVVSVALDKTTATMVVGGADETLVPTITPADATDKTVAWSSSDAAVATVAGGVVTAVGAGTATITATTTDGTKTATCTVTVNAAVVNVVSVILDKTTATMVVGGADETLVPTITPADATDKTVAWSSSDAAVATVAGGVVTAVGAGTATITATTTDGAKTATCTVTVTAAVVPILVVLNKTTTSIVVAATETLTATVTPETTVDKTVTWSSSDAAVATVVSTTGEITAVAEGTATITATSNADATKTATCAVTVTAAP